MENFRFFEFFHSVDLIFIQYLYCSWNSNLLKILRYILPFKKYSEKWFRFFNSAPPQCAAFFCKKGVFWDINGPKMSCICDNLILFFATDSWKTSYSDPFYSVFCLKISLIQILKVYWCFSTSMSLKGFLIQHSYRSGYF